MAQSTISADMGVGQQVFVLVKHCQHRDREVAPDPQRCHKQEIVVRTRWMEALSTGRSRGSAQTTLKAIPVHRIFIRVSWVAFLF